MVKSFLYRRGAGVESVGLRGELGVPLPAALVELAALDQGNTPLDRYDRFIELQTNLKYNVILIMFTNIFKYVMHII